MSILSTDLHFRLVRATGLVRRGWASLRTRGWAATWQRLRHQFSPRPRRLELPLYLPEPQPFAPFSVPNAEAPRASVVIPVHGQWPHTLACLRAIAAHPPRAGIEVIVVDDASPDETPHMLRRIEDLRWHRHEDNGGFIAACNSGAALARGEVLVFLNNDTVPQPGWLDALLDTLDAEPGAGLVGAQLLYPDGRLQEAGGVVFADGSAWNLGRGGSPADCRHAYLRDADYCSGAAIAIGRALFEQLGGFDPRYAPAYYEDTDLAFEVRATGRRVVYQPASRVVHVEGGTAGTDLDSGPKAAQRRNQSVFAAKWRQALTAQLPAGTLPTPALLHRHQRQVLVIDALTPQPDRDSGSLRLVNLMRMLREDGAHVVFLPANLRHDGEATRRLQALGVECWHAPFARDATAWLREHGPRFDVAMVCRHYVAREFLPLLRRHAPRVRLLFDTVDLHYLREQRGARATGDEALARHAGRTRVLEFEAIAGADATIVVSHVERELLATDAPDARVEVVSNVHRVRGAGPDWASRQDLLFVGGFRHPPNVDAMLWYAREVLPLLHARRPGLVLHCIGGDVPREIAQLAATPGFVVHGHVPDLEPWLDRCRVALAPLRYGAGVKGKLNQSMAHGLPGVATSVAVESMHLRDGEDVLVADEPAAFAEAIIRLHDDRALWQRLSRNGLESVARHFSPEAARETVRALFLR